MLQSFVVHPLAQAAVLVRDGLLFGKATFPIQKVLEPRLPCPVLDLEGFEGKRVHRSFLYREKYGGRTTCPRMLLPSLNLCKLILISPIRTRS